MTCVPISCMRKLKAMRLKQLLQSRKLVVGPACQLGCLLQSFLYITEVKGWRVSTRLTEGLYGSYLGPSSWERKAFI